VGGVVAMATAAGVPVLIVAGDVVADELGPDLGPSVEVVSLVARFGLARAQADVGGCVEEVVGTHLRAAPA
jgi:D-aminopeptidase